jgi:hypothetical protein
MNRAFEKFGELDPGCAFSVQPIFERAMGDFLWPSASISEERRRIVRASLFGTWCEWWMHNLSIWPPMHFNLMLMDHGPLWWAGCIEPAVPAGAWAPVPWDSSIARVPKVLRMAAGDERVIAGNLEALWRRALDVMLGRDCTKPGSRAAVRGMKFFLIVQVLRCGLWSGKYEKQLSADMVTGGKAQRRRLIPVTWDEAKDSAALFLAWSVLAARGKVGSALDSNLNEVNSAAMAAGIGAVDRVDLNPATHGMAGYRKALRMTLPATEFLMIVRLAAEYGRSSNRGLGEWMKREEMGWWFGT